MSDDWGGEDQVQEVGSLGLALSGGGFRAGAFHLGVLKRLDELEVLPQIELVSSVSGGSIVAAAYALRCVENGDGRPGSCCIDDFIKDFVVHLGHNIRGSAYTGTPYRAVRAALALCTGLRHSSLVVEEFAREMFAGATVADIPDWLLINATNIQTGKNWKFFSDVAGDYLIGATARTGDISLASAVTASAAHPLLMEPVPLQGDWKEYLETNLDDRWERPAVEEETEVSAWRERHGKSSGATEFQLVDGGVYDNEGVNGLRGANIDHAILSSASLQEYPYEEWSKYSARLRTLAVMHRRLGSVNRQFLHEATHGVHPSEARKRLMALADKLDGGSPPDAGEKVTPGELKDIAEVGWPPRGHQFKSVAMLLLHREDLAKNRSADYDERPYDIPPDDRGLSLPLLRELSTIRTDLDAHDSRVVNALIAQGYFVADANMKIGMPEAVAECTGVRDRTSEKLRPRWKWAHGVIDKAERDAELYREVFNAASTVNKPVGRSRGSLGPRLLGVMSFTALAILLFVGAVIGIAVAAI